MRGFRSTFILLVVLLGLLGYIYYYLRPGSQPPAEQKAKVFSLEVDTINALQVTSSGGEQSSLERVGGVWQLTAPFQAKADNAEVSSVVTNLASVEIQRVVDDNPGDLAQYGLAPVRVEVGFRKAGDKNFTRLQIGDKTATGGDMYVKLPAEKKVFLISSFLETAFDRTSFDLRDKTMLVFSRDNADRVEVRSQDQSLRIARVGDTWRLATPVAARADVAAVDNLIGRLQSGQMKALVSSNVTPEEAVRYGLDKPTATASVGAGAGTTLAAITIGTIAPDGTTYYARDAARPLVFTIEKSLVDDLLKKTGEYRPKEVFDFIPSNASRLELVREAGTLTIEKGKDKDGKEKWAHIAPARDLDGTKVGRALTALTDLLVARYVDGPVKTGPATPALVATVRFDDGKREERVTFVRVEGEVFATRQGEPGAAAVDAAKFGEALAALDALK
jgi:cbb3-type cytochrome oxidase subunit 3